MIWFCVMSIFCVSADKGQLLMFSMLFFVSVNIVRNAKTENGPYNILTVLSSEF
jgi:hypothetical protein